jgi:MFS family permease
MTENDKLRWVLILPSAVAAWFAAFIVGMLTMSMAEHLCPPEKLVSGACDVPWWGYVERSVSSFGAALAAVLVVAAATFVAPSHKRKVAWWSFGIGACVAALMGFLFVPELISALVAGGITAAVVSRGAKHDA